MLTTILFIVCIMLTLLLIEQKLRSHRRRARRYRYKEKSHEPSAELIPQNIPVDVPKDCAVPVVVAPAEKLPLADVIKGKIRKNYNVLSRFERQMFFLMKETLEPTYIVLAQVSFNALLWTPDPAKYQFKAYRGIRNRFNRKMADFVVLDQHFQIVAVIELDDPSHEGNEQRDEERDILLQEAGLKVIRYKEIPSVERLNVDFEMPFKEQIIRENSFVVASQEIL